MKHYYTRFIVVAALVLLVAGPSMAFSLGRAEKTSGQDAAQSSSTSGQASDSPGMAEATKNLATIQYSFREVAQKVLPVVVEVDITQQSQAGGQTASPFDYFFNQPNGRNSPPRIQQGLGSGIIVKKAGNTYYVLTNNHVVDSATTIKVKLSDETVISNVKVVGTDSRRDLAVISFTSNKNLAVADLGDSSELQVGDLVLAVGNPWGFENTVTMGIVSALGRSNQQLSQNTDYIQTDAAINEGNSGGALVNIKGEVIGINTWIATPTGGSISLGFAIPINSAKKAVDDFISKGKVEYGFLGVLPGDPAGDTLPGASKDLKVENVKGSLVLNLFKNSAADRAGLLPGDYITKANGVEIANTSRLIQAVSDLLAGKTYDFEVIRNGEKVKLSIKLSVRPADGADETAYSNMWPGLIVMHANDEARKLPGYSDIPKGVDGVMVAQTMTGNNAQDQSPAAIAGFRPGDLITQVNGKDIHTVMDFYKALNDKSKKDVTFKISRQGTDVTIGLTR